MGGDESFSFSSSLDDHSSVDDESHCSDGLGIEFEDELVNNLSGFDSGEFDQVGHLGNSSNHVEFPNNLRRRLRLNAYREIIPNNLRRRLRLNAYKEIIQSYCDSSVRIESLNEAKRAILSYTPGSLIDKEEGVELSDYDVPITTTLLLVGLKGSGKSSLINRISRVLENDKLASDRAQVSYRLFTGDGTYFLQEYMVPRGSNSFCLFDTRSLSDDLDDNDDLLESWMTNGVCHGELVIRDADDSDLRDLLNCKIRDSYMLPGPARKVNFVIFVVDGLSVLRCMNSDKEKDKWHAQVLSDAYCCPYLSFKDDKPAIVVTHGDLLTLEQRAGVRIYLSQLLGVPPTTQMFDIPESYDSFTELAILDMLKYALEHADKNLPRRTWVSRKPPPTGPPTTSCLEQVFKSCFMALLLLGLALGMNIAMLRHIPLSRLGPLLNSPCDHHHEPQANQTPDHPGQPQFNSTSQSTFFSDHHHEPPPTTRDNNQCGNLQQLNEPPSATREQNQPEKHQHPPFQSTPSQNATDKPRKWPVRPKSNFTEPKSWDNQPKSQKRTKIKLSNKQSEKVSENNQPKSQKKTKTKLSNKQSEKVSEKNQRKSQKKTKTKLSNKQSEEVSEPAISWEARRRLWLGW